MAETSPATPSTTPATTPATTLSAPITDPEVLAVIAEHNEVTRLAQRLFPVWQPLRWYGRWGSAQLHTFRVPAVGRYVAATLRLGALHLSLSWHDQARDARYQYAWEAHRRALLLGERRI